MEKTYGMMAAVSVMEEVFPVILYMQAKLIMVRLSVTPKEGLQIVQEGEEIQIPFVVENCGRSDLSALWLKVERKSYLIRKLKRGERHTIFFSLGKDSKFILKDELGYVIISVT